LLLSQDGQAKFLLRKNQDRARSSNPKFTRKPDAEPIGVGLLAPASRINPKPKLR
jgi:hypothetical protein